MEGVISRFWSARNHLEYKIDLSAGIQEFVVKCLSCSIISNLLEELFSYLIAGNPLRTQFYSQYNKHCSVFIELNIIDELITSSLLRLQTDRPGGQTVGKAGLRWKTNVVFWDYFVK